jgi:hypothetical protein
LRCAQAAAPCIVIQHPSKDRTPASAAFRASVSLACRRRGFGYPAPGRHEPTSTGFSPGHPSGAAINHRSARRQPWDARAMRRSRQMLTKERVICAAFLCMVAALPGCSAASPVAGPPTAIAVPSAGAAFAFTVAGARPVPPNGSQDTHAQTPKAACDNARFAADEVLGSNVADGFALAGFPASADLLTHFLQGKGTEVDYRAGSPISEKALSSSAFQAVNNEVQRAILSRLKAG